MPLYRVTVKQMKVANGLRIEKGMTADVVANSISNPVVTNGGQLVNEAFQRLYGIDLKKLGALNMIYLDVKQIG